MTANKIFHIINAPNDLKLYVSTINSCENLSNLRPTNLYKPLASYLGCCPFVIQVNTHPKWTPTDLHHFKNNSWSKSPKTPLPKTIPTNRFTSFHSTTHKTSSARLVLRAKLFKIPANRFTSFHFLSCNTCTVSSHLAYNWRELQ